MRLDEFIKETILQIAKGVQDANNELKNTESLARVAPMGAYDYQGMPAMRPLTNEKIKSSAPVSLVEFRVKVETSSNEEAATKIGGNIKVISADKDVRTKDQESQVHEISFCVPLALYQR